MTSIADVLGGHYRLDRLLGRGGMSDVYQATELTSGEQVALKVVRSGDPEFARRLAREAKVLESFDHPGLVHLLDIGVTGDQAFLVMDLVDGPTLAQALEHGPLGSKRSAALGARLAGALAYVHERGIVHRDVKPSNILLNAQGEAKLGDFGIARDDDATSHTVTGSTVGTVSYMAPEQLEDHQVGPGADVWSLGIVLLECLTGERAYRGTPSEVMARRIAGPVELPADLPAPWRQVLSGMLERRPDRRLTAGQAAALLATAAFDQPWTPLDSDATRRIVPIVANDATSVFPGGVAQGSGGDETLVVAARTSPEAPRSQRNWWRIAAIGALVVALVWAVLAAALSGNPPTSTTTSSTSTSTTSSSTTTTTPPGSLGSNELSTLLADVVLAQNAGGIDGPTSQSIIQSASDAVTQYNAGQKVLAASDLQQTSATIANALASGVLSSSDAAILQNDLVHLASALKLASAVTTTTSTAVPTSNGPGPGNGNGNGNGH